MTTVALVGPTASGKSALALAVARARPQLELVSADAMQVYRGMDIGTAKPSPTEQAEVRHHGIDLVEPDTEFTVADFQRHVDESLTDIAGRGAVPMLVGGTGLYLRAVIDGLTLPGSWPEIRAELERNPDQAGLFNQLQRLDPLAAARTEPTNKRRIARALEVCLGSGRAFSSFGPGLESYPPTRYTQIGLRWERDELARRIEQRVTTMLHSGFLDEVRRLDVRVLSRTARQALGYRELLQHLHGEISYDDAVAAIILRTRQFAVRQDRWFRRDPRIRWVDVRGDAVSEALPVVLEALEV